MAITADRVIVELEAKLDKYKREIAEGDRKFDQSMKNIRRNAGVAEAQTTKSFNAIGRASKQMGDSLRTSALALATVAGAGAGVRVLADFAQAMSTVRAVAQATDSQFEALEKRARELGASTRFSATQAAEGMLFLARAGFDTEQVLGSIEGTLQLAQAGNMDLGRAADIASNVLQGFRLEVADTARVVDVLALAANSSNTDVTQLGEAMKYAAPIAAGLGVGVEDTAAAVSALSDAGLQGQMAGTGLRRVMIGLEKQSSQGEKVLKKYDLTMQDIALGSTGSLAESLNRLAEAGISTADAMTLFGLRGGPAFEVLQSSIPKVRELTSAYEEAGGTAERIAEVMDANLNGALLATKSRLEELILALGDAGAEDGLIIALEGLQRLLVLAAENADVLTVAIVALTVRAMLPMAAAVVGRALPALATLSTSLQLLTVRGGAALVATRALAGGMALLNPATLIVAAAAGAYLLLARNAREGRAAIDEARRVIEGLNRVIEETDKYRAFEELSKDANFAIPIMDRLKTTIEGVADAIREVTTASIVQEINKLSTEIQAGEKALENLERQRSRVLASRGASTTGFGSTGGVQGSDDTETKFDDEILRLRQEIAYAESQLRGAAQSAFGEGGINIVEKFREGGIEAVEQALDKRFTEITNASVIEKELENVKALTTALEDAKGKGLDRAADRFSEQIAIAEETIRLLQSGLDESTARGLATETVREGRGGGGEDLSKQEARAISAIESAWSDALLTRREQAEKNYQDAIADIESLSVAQARKDDLAQKALETRDASLKDIRQEERDGINQLLDDRDKALGKEVDIINRRAKLAKEAAQEEFDVEADKNRAVDLIEQKRLADVKAYNEQEAAEKQALLDEMLAARERALGNYEALAEAEYRALVAQIEKELTAEEGKYEALAALEVAHRETVKDIREQMHQDRLNEALQEADTIGEGFRAQWNIMRDEAERAAGDIGIMFAETFGPGGSVHEAIGSAAGQAIAFGDSFSESIESAARAIGSDLIGALVSFGLQLATQAALGQALGASAVATTSAQAAISAAAWAPAAAAASLATLGANAAPASAALSAVHALSTALSAVPGFADGVIGFRGKGTSRSDSNLAYISDGESVISEKGTRVNPNVLKNINAGIDVEAQLARINQPVAITPSFMTSGGRTVQVGGAQLNFNGPVDRDTIPELRAMVEQLSADQESRISAAIAADKVATTPRYQRNKFIR
ncbi:MAG: phage tail tape measure protein [Hyphomicrobiales bacterium]